jgi:hypothetical protein
MESLGSGPGDRQPLANRAKVDMYFMTELRADTCTYSW